MPLTVQQLGLSRYRPWRIVLQRTEVKGLRTASPDPDPQSSARSPQSSSVLSPQHSVLCFTPWAPPGTTPLVLPSTGCVTESEARGLLAQLEPVGDWDAYATWTLAQQQAALDVLAASPSEQAKDARLRRRRHYEWAPWRTLPCP